MTLSPHRSVRFEQNIVTQTATRQSPPPSAPAAKTATPWILGSWQDLLLFVATPVLIVPLIYLAKTRYTVEGIALFVAAFGACGHHLPGAMRAYGDRELFQRFKVRFIVAPIFLLAVCVTANWYQSQTLNVVAILWGLWHGLAQIYGFARIYDAKVRSFAPLTARLDLALCATWFCLGMLYSPGRLYGLLNAFYAAGGPLVEPSYVEYFKQVWLVLTLLATAAFVANMAVRSLRGEPQSGVKVVLLVSSIAFWWYTMVAIDNVILGIALFEVFHDVQYLAIVWVYNRRRVEQQGSMAGAFTRFLFRRSGLMVGLYLGMIFAYGALGLIRDEGQMDGAKRILTGVLVFSTLLHFYYDGFIWKVRERSTRAGLGLQGGTADAAGPQHFLPGWLAHGLKWSLFVVPVGLATWGEIRGGAPQLDRQENLVAAVPSSAEAHYQLAVVLQNNHCEAEAAEQFAAAVELNPDNAEAQFRLANSRLNRRRPQEAIKHYQAALQRKPDHADARNNLASALVSAGRPDEAQAELERIVRDSPRHAAAHNNLGNLLASQGQADAAMQHFRLAIDADPAYLEARQNLAFQLAMSGQLDASIAEYRRAIEYAPTRAEPHMALGMVLYRAGQAADALREFQFASDLNPQWPAPWRMQAWLLATHPDDEFRDASKALRCAEQAAEVSQPDDSETLDALAAAQANAGDFAAAIDSQQAALTAGEEARLPKAQLTEMRERLALYRRGQPHRDGALEPR